MTCAVSLYRCYYSISSLTTAANFFAPFSIPFKLLDVTRFSPSSDRKVYVLNIFKQEILGTCHSQSLDILKSIYYFNFLLCLLNLCFHVT